MPFPEQLEIQPIHKPPCAAIQVPGSKSITNRSLVLAALMARGYAIALRNVLRSEDTEIMIDCLRALGFRVLTEWPESAVFVSSEVDEPIIPAPGADLFVGNSGTTMRFLTALVSLGHGVYRLDGVPRMQERPIADLLSALAQLGVRANCEKQNGCPPVVVTANGLNGGRVRIRGDVSSQFLSGLLMAAPWAQSDVTVEVEGPLVSWPYVYMTVQMLLEWGLQIWNPDDGAAQWAPLQGKRRDWREGISDRFRGIRFKIGGRQDRRVEDYPEQAATAAILAGQDPRRHVWLRDYQIEPDASAASYFFGAAAITGGTLGVTGLPRNALQGDIRFVEVLADLGCKVADADTGLTVKGGPLQGIDVDMNDISDTVMTLAAIACFARGPTTIRNVAHIRHKETDRLAALAAELRKVGAEVEEFADGLKITPRPLHGAVIDTYNDHRMAMSMALIGLRVPGIVIRNPGCVAKTYPGFWDDLERLRAH